MVFCTDSLQKHTVALPNSTIVDLLGAPLPKRGYIIKKCWASTDFFDSHCIFQLFVGWKIFLVVICYKAEVVYIVQPYLADFIAFLMSDAKQQYCASKAFNVGG